jgi:hypothetical protein
MLRSEPVGHEYYWRGEAERGMLPFPVIERFDVVKEVSLCFRVRAVTGAMHPLILQTVEEA